VIDTNAIIRTFLAAQSGITTLTGSRIFGPPGLPPRYSISDGAAISFFTRGGGSETHYPVLRPSVQFNCWAATPIAARQVYRALFDALWYVKDEKIGSAYILSATEDTAGQDLRDPDEPTWFYVLSLWTIRIIEN